jgi:2-keto-myo-inositol isomerase
MYISYNEACAMGCSSLEQDLVLCEKAGFDYIEIRLDMLRKYLETHTVQDLADFFKTSRLRPHAINALYVYPELFGPGDDPLKRNSLMEEFQLGCRTGRAIGSSYFIVVPPLQRDPKGGPFVGTREETLENCVRILKRLSVIAGEYGMNLCFELVGFERSSVRSIKEADDIVKAVNEKNVGFVFDSYNIYLNGGLNDFSGIKQVDPAKIFAVHLMSGDDVPAEERGQDKRCFCGSGAVDTDSFVRTLGETGYTGMVSAETFRPEYWRREPSWVINEAYRTLRECLQKNRAL